MKKLELNQMEITFAGTAEAMGCGEAVIMSGIIGSMFGIPIITMVATALGPNCLNIFNQ